MKNTHKHTHTHTNCVSMSIPAQTSLLGRLFSNIAATAAVAASMSLATLTSSIVAFAVGVIDVFVVVVVVVFVVADGCQACAGTNGPMQQSKCANRSMGTTKSSATSTLSACLRKLKDNIHTNQNNCARAGTRASKHEPQRTPHSCSLANAISAIRS